MNNESKNTAYFKLVISGSVNSGKTTFVKTISEFDPITTDEYATEENVKVLKGQTTVAMDYGRRTIDEDVVLHIYATPGQERFNFMWDVLVEGAFGVIFLADSTDLDSISNTKKIIKYFSEKFNLPYLLCVTKLDMPVSIDYKEVLKLIDKQDLFAIPCNTTQKEDVRTALIALLSLAIDKAAAQT
ncbi:MAG: ATP/GTP-binding protein [Bacteriovoracaceae bacterium]|nr:ATP/GTP-binding protein [Bacteroidota bacterium]